MITDCLALQSSPARALRRFCEPSSKRHGRKRNGSCAHPWIIRGWAGEDCPWTVASSEHCLIAVRGAYPRCPEAPKHFPLWGPLGIYPGGYPYHWTMAPYDDLLSFVGAFPQAKPDRENPKPERLAYLLGSQRGPYSMDEIGWALSWLNDLSVSFSGKARRASTRRRSPVC